MRQKSLAGGFWGREIFKFITTWRLYHLAAQTEQPDSDIDVMVIGQLGLREIVGKLVGVTAKLGREINPHSFQASEWLERLQRGDHFVMMVMEQPKDFLLGDPDEFARLA